MTDEPMVERLERLEREATPGPWKVDAEVPDLIIGLDGWLLLWVSAEWRCRERRTGCRHAYHSPALLSQLREQRERAELAEIERDTAQAQVRAKQSWMTE